MDHLIPDDGDPLLEVIKTLHRQQNEFTDSYNRTGNVGDAMSAAVAGMIATRVMIRLRDLLPPEVYNNLHRRAFDEAPLKSMSMR